MSYHGSQQVTLLGCLVTLKRACAHLRDALGKVTSPHRGRGWCYGSRFEIRRQGSQHLREQTSKLSALFEDIAYPKVLNGFLNHVGKYGKDGCQVTWKQSQ